MAAETKIAFFFFFLLLAGVHCERKKRVFICAKMEEKERETKEELTSMRQITKKENKRGKSPQKKKNDS